MDAVLEAAALGFLGSAHCLGMCGVFAASVGAGARGAGGAAFLGRMLAYLAGKTLGYVFLGTLMATAGRQLLSHGALHAWRWMATALAAAVVLATAARLGGWLPAMALPARLATTASRWIPWRSFATAARSLPGIGGAAAFGLVNAWIPCGLVVAAALLAAAAASPASAALSMAAFGLATAPALTLAALAGRFMAAAPGAAVRRIAAVLLVLLAGVALWRAGVSPPACCAP